MIADFFIMIINFFIWLIASVVTLITAIPVSYTHLDVYKRQVVGGDHRIDTVTPAVVLAGSELRLRLKL